METRFTLDARGVLTPKDPEHAQEVLPPKGGEYLLFPSSHDLLCFLRSTPSGTASKPPRVVLAGDAAAFPVSDLVAFLGQSRWSGVVRVRNQSGDRSILLKEGEVRGALSDNLADRVGEVIVRLGYASREQLDEVLKDTPPSKVGRVMVERNLLQPHDLWKCLTEQVSEVFHAIVIAKEGAFALIEQEFDEKSIHTLNLPMQSLLMDAIRKIDEMALFRKRIPHGRVYVTKKRPSDGKLEPEEDLVLGLANGERNVLELGVAAKLNEFDVTKIVYRLLEGGFAQVVERAVPAAPPPPPAAGPRTSAAAPSRAHNAVRVFNSIFREIRAEVAKRRMDREFIAAANAALKGRALSASPVLENLALDPDGSLPEGQLLAQFERLQPQMGSEPLASLRQALSDVMFFLLFQAGELLESQADEDLARRVKELLASLEQD